MLNLLKTKKNINKVILSEQNKGEDIGVIRHFPATTKSWFNSIYSFNKNTVKSIPVLDNIVNKIIRMYFNLKSNVNLKKIFERRRTKTRRLSTTKIFVSKAEMKHTNDKVIINLYTYNRNKKYFIRKLRRLYRRIFTYSRSSNLDLNNINPFLIKQISKKDVFKIKKLFNFINNKNKLLGNEKSGLKWRKNYKKYAKLFLYKYLLNSKNVALNNDNLIHKKYVGISNKSSLIFDKFLSRSNNIIKLLEEKNLNHIIPFIKNKRFSYLLKTKNNNTYNKYNNIYYNEFIKNSLKKEMLYLKFNQLLNIDTNKFNSIYLSRLGRLISNIYNKKIEFNIINLKYMFLDSHIFSESILLKIRNRKNKLIKVLKKAMKFQKLNLIKKYRYNLQNFYLKRYNEFSNNVYLNTPNNDVLDFILNRIFNVKDVTSKIHKSNSHKSIYIYRSIRFRKIRGVRIEAKGRLTRRLTASRAILKLRYRGSLNNLDSSVNKLSSVMLRNNIRSNIDYVNLNSKTRNGSFGIKGWISSR
jgi:hypothetical protein